MEERLYHPEHRAKLISARYDIPYYNDFDNKGNIRYYFMDDEKFKEVLFDMASLIKRSKSPFGNCSEGNYTYH